jgi:hypothetical protein
MPTIRYFSIYLSKIIKQIIKHISKLQYYSSIVLILLTYQSFQLTDELRKKRNKLTSYRQTQKRTKRVEKRSSLRICS